MPSDTVAFIDVSFTENGLRPRRAEFGYALALGRAETAVCQRRRWPKRSSALSSAARTLSWL
jgi:hypothetical protein